MERLSFLLLRRPYRCIKCQRVQLGFLFLDFHWQSVCNLKRKTTARDTKTLAELKCPECGGQVWRSRRRGVERLLFFTKAYRCCECEARFRTFNVG